MRIRFLLQKDAKINNINIFLEGGKRISVARGTKSLIYMICKDNLPHSIVEKVGFCKFAKVAVPLYKVPNRKTVSNINLTSNLL